MKKLIIAAGVILLSALSTTMAGELKGFSILPKPQEVELVRSSVLGANELKYLVVDGDADVPVLGSELSRLRQMKTSGKGVVLRLVQSGVPESREGYVLRISKGGVVVEARNAVGLFYGCGTLEQMLEDCRDFGLRLPEVTITDYPSVGYRAVYFDNKHHLSRTKYYYDVIDKLARYKVNAVIWEIEDKLRYERRPEVGAPNALSIQELQALSRYAMERNVEISPLIQGLGHAGFILKHHWELRENPRSDWEFCPSNPKTYELQFDLYRDAMDAFPHGRYLHVGGDEITAIGIDERCRETGKSAFALQMEWLGKVCEFVVENGRIPIFWDDMPLKHGGLWYLMYGGHSDEYVAQRWNTERMDKAVDMFPKECVYMRWDYDDPTHYGNIATMEWYDKAGLKVMAATGASTGDSPFMPRQNSRAQYIKDFSSLVAKNNLEGILATAWDDGSPHWETVMRGYIAQGEFGWNPTGRSVEEFVTAHAQREFGLINNEIKFLEKLEKLAFFFDNALIVSGRRNPSWQVRDYKLMDVPNPEKPGEWTEKYAEKLTAAKDAKTQATVIAQELETAKGLSLRNRYTLEIYEQNLAQFLFPALLLEAMAQFDAATNDKQRADAKTALNQVFADFRTMRQKFENVYSETRFMRQPNGYIEDMNHHKHLSALTLNSDWMFLYELAMINKLRQTILK